MVGGMGLSINWFPSNLWILVALTIAVALSARLIYHVVLTCRGRMRRNSRYIVHGTDLLRNRVSVIPGLDIRLREGVLESNDSLTISEILFVIERSGFTGKAGGKRDEPVVVKMPNGAIITHCRAFSDTNVPDAHLHITTSSDKKTCKFDSDFVGHNEGGVVQIVHTGIQSDEISIDGPVRAFGDVLTPIRSISVLFNSSAIVSTVLLFLFFTLALAPNGGHWTEIYDSLESGQRDLFAVMTNDKQKETLSAVVASQTRVVGDTVIAEANSSHKRAHVLSCYVFRVFLDT